jgi:redox-sensitive bicupin YhaK (pirin superfamily)
MISIRKSDERGHFDHGWLSTYHTFSFADYHNPEHMGFRKLRVINEDWIQPNSEFGTHPHRDMEIITYILEGELTHKDSMGNGSVIKPGDVQRMTAGTGILHSESNKSTTDVVHLFQIWIFPEEKGLKPEYEQKPFPESERVDQFRLLASPDGRDGSLTIHQDVSLYNAIIFQGNLINFDLAFGRHAWAQVVSGHIDLNGNELKTGDGAAITSEEVLRFTGKEKSEILLFDLA